MAGDGVIVAGFGFRAAATAQSLADALDRAGGAARVDALAAPSDKASAPTFAAFASARALPVHPIDAETLARQDTPTRSPAALKARGVGSVAEAAALAAAGRGARLVAPRAVSADGMATCALAEGSGA